MINADLLKSITKRLAVGAIVCCILLTALTVYAFSNDSIAGERISGEQIAELALQYDGYPYVYGGNSPNGFDCSGFVQYIYSRSGYEISRVCSSQYYDGEHIGINDLCAGDIVLFSNTYTAGLSHAGIYLGDNRFIHAANAASGVTVTEMSDSYYRSRFTTGVRVAGIADSVCQEICETAFSENGKLPIIKNIGTESAWNSIMRMPQ